MPDDDGPGESPGGMRFKRYGDGPGKGDNEGGPGSEGPGKEFYRPKPVGKDLDKATGGKKGLADRYRTTGGE